MKNLYIKPVTHVVALTNDSVLQGLSEEYETSDFGAKRNNYFTDDSFDFTDWPKSKSSWETDD